MTSTRILSIAGLLIGAVPAFSALAASPSDVGELTYQCRVDGIDSACDALPASPPTPSHHLAPGSYAAYLVYLGVSPEKALELAHEKGDDTLLRIVDTTPPGEQTGYEMYLRYLGREPALGSNAMAAGEGHQASR